MLNVKLFSLLFLGLPVFLVGQTASPVFHCGAAPKLDPITTETIDPREQSDFFGPTQTLQTFTQGLVRANDCMGTGFYNIQLSGSFSDHEQNTICEVFAYLSSVIDNPQDNPVTIIIRKDQLAKGVGGAGGPLYAPDHSCGIQANPIWNQIYQGVSAQEGAQGIIYVNTDPSIPWHLDSRDGQLQGSNRLDLFTVILHEAIHAHGFIAQVTADGQSRRGYFSHWDSRLVSEDGESVLLPAATSSTCCDHHEFNTGAFPITEGTLWAKACGATPSLHFDGPGLPAIGADYDETAVFDSADDLLSNVLSHLCEEDAVMNANLSRGIRKKLTTSEQKILCQLGYELKGDGCAKEPPCRVVANPDVFTVYGPPDHIFIPLNGTADDPGIFDNDHGESLGTRSIRLLANCGDADVVSAERLGSRIRLENLQIGQNVICYELTACEGVCDQGMIIVDVIPESFDCENNDQCEQLLCFGDFEAFDQPLTGGRLDALHIDNFRFFGQNSVDIHAGDFSCGITGNWCDEKISTCSQGGSGSPIPAMSKTGGQKYINIGRTNAFTEGFYIPLNRTLQAGEQYTLDYSLLNGCSTELWLAFTDEIPCPYLTGPEIGAVFFDQNQSSISCNAGYPMTILGRLIEPLTPTKSETGLEWESRSSSVYTAVGGERFLVIGVPIETGSESTKRNLLLDNFVLRGTILAELEIDAQSDFACIGGEAEITYEVCRTTEDDLSQAIQVELQASFTKSSTVTFSENGDFDPEGLAKLLIPTGEQCAVATLLMDVPSATIRNTTLTVDLAANSTQACLNLSESKTTTVVLEDTEVAPIADFSVEQDNCPDVYFASANQEESSTYFWDFGDGQTSTEANPQHSYELGEETYTVIHCVENSCGRTCTEQQIELDCAPAPRLSCQCDHPDRLLIAGGLLSESPVLPVSEYNNTGNCLTIRGQWLIDRNLRITGGEIILEPGASIVIAPFVSLILNQINENGGIHGCEKLWKGIEVQSSANLQIRDSWIQDAETAIEVQSGAGVQVINNVFNANYMGIDAQLGTSAGPQWINFELAGNLFTADRPLFLPQESWPGFTTDQAYAGLRINGGLGMILGGTWAMPAANQIEQHQYGILIENSVQLTLPQWIVSGADKSSVGIQLTNSDHIVIEDAEITEVGLGINGHNSWPIIRHSGIVAAQRGIQLDHGYFKNVFIGQNQITAGESAIDIRNYTSLSADGTLTDVKLEIIDNHLSSTHPNSGNAGIRFERVFAPLYIGGNQIMDGANTAEDVHRGIGIHGSNSGLPDFPGSIQIGNLAGANQIAYSQPSTTTAILLENIDAAHVAYNAINTEPESARIAWGIRMRNARNCVVDANQVSRSQVPLWVDEQEEPTTRRSSQLALKSVAANQQEAVPTTDPFLKLDQTIESFYQSNEDQQLTLNKQWSILGNLDNKQIATPLTKVEANRLATISQTMAKTHQRNLADRRAAQNSLLTQNQAILVTTTPEQNTQWVNQVFLESTFVEQEKLTSQQQEVIETIAQQCPEVGGLAVYRARGIQSAYQEQYYPDENCGTGSLKTENSASLSAGFESIFRVNAYPNPAIDWVTVELEQPDAALQLGLYSLDGKQLQRQEVQKELTRIDVSVYPEGTYFIHLYHPVKGRIGVKQFVITRS